MSSIIEGHTYDIFISCRQRKEGEIGRGGDRSEGARERGSEGAKEIQNLCIVIYRLQ